MADLLRMDEFDQQEVEWCRRSYWGARDDWHKTLIDCYNTALARPTNQPRKEPA